MLRKLRFTLLAIVLVAIVGVSANVIAGNTPALGLDLQGGVSVTLEPEGDPSPEAVSAAVDLIRQRVDALGVAEPEIVPQGNAVVVNLPGIDDTQEALDVISASGQVFLRPVLQVFQTTPTDDTTDTSVPGDSTPDSTPDSAVPGDTTPDSTPDSTVDSTPTTDAPTTDAPTTDAPTTDAPTTTAAEGPSRVAPASSGSSVPATEAPTTDAPTTEAPTTEVPSTEAPGDTVAPGDTGAPGDTVAPGDTEAPTDTLPVADTPDTMNPVPDQEGEFAYFLGPAGATGEVLEQGASVQIQNGERVIVVGIRPEGQPLWNALAVECYNRSESCPTGQLAIQLDREVISAPVVQEPNFGSEVVISGGFSESEATKLAKILEFGSLPVQFVPQSVQQVSATLGEDALNAAIIAGIVGVLLVLLLLFFYYRSLTIVIVGGLFVFGSLNWIVISLISVTNGLSLTLSGTAGLIVSVGITVDSYVVYFEKLKDELRAGRTFKNSAQRAFDGAWKTILIADSVSFLGALILWSLTVGSVRGFAFFLGLATLADMIVAYFYTRPAVVLLSRSKWFQSSKVLAVEIGEGTDDLTRRRGSVFQRLYHGETTYDFYGKRMRGFVVSAVAVVASLVAFFGPGLNLGIDFEGGVAWEVPAETLTTDQATAVVEENGIDTNGAKVQTLSSSSTGERIRIQVGDQTVEVREAVRQDLAAAAGVDVEEVSVSAVSASWGDSITEKAVRALLIFFVVVSIFIAWRFEWKMALAAFAAMIHDIVISVGIYALLGFEITPATVVSFLTILGYSLYDTIVVFDKVRDNTEAYRSHRVPYADIVNVSMNQVLMRSLNTSISSVMPVLSLLFVGSFLLGATALQEFALALLVGMIAGAYSSIFVATPLLAMFKEREPRFRSLRGSHATGESLHLLSVAGPSAVKRDPVRKQRSTGTATTTGETGAVATEESSAGVLDPEVVLTHAPRPRKKRRR